VNVHQSPVVHALHLVSAALGTISGVVEGSVQCFDIRFSSPRQHNFVRQEIFCVWKELVSCLERTYFVFGCNVVWQEEGWALRCGHSRWCLPADGD